MLNKLWKPTVTKLYHIVADFWGLGAKVWMFCFLLLSQHFFFNPVICPGLNNEEYQIVIGNDTTRYIIDDLEPAHNYTFYVVAYMPMGASRMSDNVFQHTLEDGEVYNNKQKKSLMQSIQNKK